MTVRLSLSMAMLLALTLSTASLEAAPYASGIRNTTGTNYEFVLNEAADSVVVKFDSGPDLTLGALGAGRHTFDLGAASTYEIQVARNAAVGFASVDDSANLFTSFDRPAGMAINTIPSSPYFGTVYVNQVRSLNGGVQVTTGAGRDMGNGVYALTADRMGVDLPTWAVPANANDTSLAKIPGITFEADSTLGGANSMYRLGMDAAGTLIASDWSDVAGGLKYLSPDLTTGGPLLRGEAGPTGGVLSDDSDEFGLIPLHGSVVGEPQVTGTYGVDLVVSAMDEDLDADLQIDAATDGNHVWTWNVGSTTSNYAGAPSLTARVGDLYTSTGQDRNSSGVVQGGLSGNPTGTHSDGSPVFLDSNIGVTANAQYNAHFDKWYLSGSRSNGDDSSSLVILSADSSPTADGRDIEVDWASKQFTIDAGLDGFTDDEEAPLSLDPNNDIFRQAHNVAFSPDNTMMYVQRRIVHAENPVLGTGTDLGTAILGVPLDADGLPVVEIDDNGTAGDTSDDFITNFVAIPTSKNPGSQGSLSNLKVDAAGNIFFSDNISERLEYISLGGNTIATTSSAGTFEIVTVEALEGDYNGDGMVDAADYTVWRDSLGDSVVAGAGADGNGNGVIDGPSSGAGNDYEVWTNNYGSSSASLSSAVPEPSSILMAALAMVGFSRRRVA